MLIEDYKLMVRSNIAMNDYELKKLCNKIYKTHKQAFDLIWDHKDDASYHAYNIINKYIAEKVADGLIKYDENNSSKTYIRFTTPALENKFPLLEDDNSAWNNKHTVFYEIIIRKKYLFAQIAFGYKGVDRQKRYKEALNYLEAIGLKANNKYSEKAGWLTKSLSCYTSFDDLLLEEEQDENYIFGELDKKILKVLKKEREVFGS